MHRSPFVLTGFVLAALGVLLVAVNADTLPRYGARYQQDCNLCHYNPAGGGQRDLYATTYIVPAEMAIPDYDPDGNALLNPQIGESIVVGADVRTLFVKSDKPDSSPVPRRDLENFFEMQGNLYLHLQLDSRFALQMTYGLSQESEVFGLGYILPANGYVNLGRFVPAFGWRFDDHTRFVRDYLGFFPPNHTDVGLELGISPEPVSLTVSLLNGQLGAIQDFDENVAVAARGMVTLRGDVVSAQVGGSYLNNRTPAGTSHAGGPFWAFRAGKFTWVGEADIVSEKGAGVSESTVSWITSNELAYPLRRGVDLIGTFDFIDPDRDSDGLLIARAGLGIETMPTPFLKLNALVNRYILNEGAENYTQFILQAHIFN